MLLKINLVLWYNFWLKEERKEILWRNENKSFSSRRSEREQVGNFFFYYFFLLLVMYIMWQQERKIFKYKANEIENFIAVYKAKSEHIAIHMERTQCMIYQKRNNGRRNNKEMACNNFLFLYIHMFNLYSNRCPLLVQSKEFFRGRAFFHRSRWNEEWRSERYFFPVF